MKSINNLRILTLIIVCADVFGKYVLCDCNFEMENGSVSSSAKLVSTDKDTEIIISSQSSCLLRLLVVGGGGDGNSAGVGGGGGSGYIQYQSIILDPGHHSIIAKVGDRTQSSTVMIDEESITAESGEDGGDYPGGDGYSGGGGHGDMCSGGSNGGHGYCIDGGVYGGGYGTGEDIREYIFTTWTLTPGDGGSFVEDGWHSYSGGGGGGVLVDGEGPQETTGVRGQGYGGGGNGYYGVWYGEGLQGVVLLEIEPVAFDI